MTFVLAYRPEPIGTDIHQKLTNTVLAELEAGRFPWILPWPECGVPPSLPINPVTGMRWTGVGTLGLWHATRAAGYSIQSWLTVEQVRRVGGRVRWGEVATTIFVAPVAPVFPSRGGPDHVWRYLDLLVPAAVVNVAQCEDLPLHMSKPLAEPPCDRDAVFDELIAATGITFRLGAFRTFYSAPEDMIALADWRDRDLTDFYRDWIHELIHATGHPDRLGRPMPSAFGSTAHGFEDLVAEMGAAFVCAVLGIEPALRHADGLDRWVALLRADNRAFASAAAAASAAAEYVIALRDAQTAAFDRMEVEDAAAERAAAAVVAVGSRRRRQEERERWASGQMTGLRPRESLPAARPGDPMWQSLSSSSS